jgi:hypothetical protein
MPDPVFFNDKMRYVLLLQTVAHGQTSLAGADNHYGIM